MAARISACGNIKGQKSTLIRHLASRRHWTSNGLRIITLPSVTWIQPYSNLIIINSQNPSEITDLAAGATSTITKFEWTIPPDNFITAQKWNLLPSLRSADKPPLSQKIPIWLVYGKTASFGLCNLTLRRSIWNYKDALRIQIGF